MIDDDIDNDINVKIVFTILACSFKILKTDD